MDADAFMRKDWTERIGELRVWMDEEEFKDVFKEIGILLRSEEPKHGFQGHPPVEPREFCRLRILELKAELHGMADGSIDFDPELFAGFRKKIELFEWLYQTPDLLDEIDQFPIIKKAVHELVLEPDKRRCKLEREIAKAKGHLLQLEIQLLAHDESTKSEYERGEALERVNAELLKLDLYTYERILIFKALLVQLWKMSPEEEFLFLASSPDSLLGLETAIHEVISPDRIAREDS